MSTIRELVQPVYQEDPNFSRAEFARNHGLNVRLVYKALEKIKKEQNGGIPLLPVEIEQKDEARPRTITVSELIDKERLDVKKIIRQGINKIPRGEVAYEETFRRDLGISNDKWRDFARDDEFETFRAILPTRKVVWGQAPTIQDLRRQDGVI